MCILIRLRFPSPLRSSRSISHFFLSYEVNYLVLCKQTQFFGKLIKHGYARCVRGENVMRQPNRNHLRMGVGKRRVHIALFALFAAVPSALAFEGSTQLGSGTDSSLGPLFSSTFCPGKRLSFVQAMMVFLSHIAKTKAVH